MERCTLEISLDKTPFRDSDAALTALSRRPGSNPAIQPGHGPGSITRLWLAARATLSSHKHRTTSHHPESAALTIAPALPPRRHGATVHTRLLRTNHLPLPLVLVLPSQDDSPLEFAKWCIMPLTNPPLHDLFRILSLSLSLSRRQPWRELEHLDRIDALAQRATPPATFAFAVHATCLALLLRVVGDGEPHAVG